MLYTWRSKECWYTDAEYSSTTRSIERERSSSDARPLLYVRMKAHNGANLLTPLTVPLSKMLSRRCR